MVGDCDGGVRSGHAGLRGRVSWLAELIVGIIATTPDFGLLKQRTLEY